MNRAALDTSTLVRIVLLLVAALLVLILVQALLEFTFWLVFKALPVLIAIAIVVLVVLWLLDRI